MDYEKADVWEKSMRVGEQACRIATRLRSGQRLAMRSQVTRAAISVPSNIAEGWRRGSAKEKAQFFAIAHGSLAELHTQILLCQRLGWLAEADTAVIHQLIADVGAMLAVLRKKWRGDLKPARARNTT